MEDAIYDLAHAIGWVLGEGKDVYDSGTGICYYNDQFEIHGFWQHDDEDCDCGGWEEGRACKDYCGSDPWLFHHYESGFKAKWYKRIGRSYEDNGVEIKTLDKYKMIVGLLESIRDDENPEWRCKYRD